MYPQTFQLECPSFTGPIDLLVHEVKSGGVDIFALCLREILEQFAGQLGQEPLEEGSTFLPLAAHLMQIKSFSLLPRQEDQEGTPEDDSKELLANVLIEYYRFQDAASLLNEWAKEQEGLFPRSKQPVETERYVDFEEVEADDLARLFEELIRNAPKGIEIQEEKWTVSSQIEAIRELLFETDHLPFEELFAIHQGRERLVVNFLALLELMRQGWLMVGIEGSSLTIRRKDG